MASTITLSGDYMTSVGNRIMTHGTGNLGTYSSGGIAVTAAQLGLGVVEILNLEAAGGYLFRWDKANGKVMAYQSDDAVDPLDEVGSTDISAVVFRWNAFGY
jgi:hypothetical protein